MNGYVFDNICVSEKCIKAHSKGTECFKLSSGKSNPAFNLNNHDQISKASLLPTATLGRQGEDGDQPGHFLTALAPGEGTGKHAWTKTYVSCSAMQKGGKKSVSRE